MLFLEREEEVIRINLSSLLLLKGRARAANSKYYLLVEKDNFYSTFHDEMINFLEIEDVSV